MDQAQPLYLPELGKIHQALLQQQEGRHCLANLHAACKVSVEAHAAFAALQIWELYWAHAGCCSCSQKKKSGAMLSLLTLSHLHTFL